MTLAGCKTNTDSARGPVGGPAREGAEKFKLDSWRSIWASSVQGGEVVRELRGYVQKSRFEGEPVEDAVEFFYVDGDLDAPIGFRLPSGDTFRYTRSRSGSIDEESIGRHTTENAVHRLLDISEDIEFGEVREKAP